MTTKRLLLLTTTLVCVTSFAQEEIVINSFECDPLSLEAKLYPRTDANGKAGSLVCISLTSEEVEFDGNILGESTLEHGVWMVYLSSESKSMRICVRGYHPYDFIFPCELESYRTYKLKITLPVKDKYRAILLPSISIASSQMSYGLMAGFVRKFGGYVRAKTDFILDLSTVGACDSDGNIQGGGSVRLSGNSKKARFAFTGGGVFRIAKPFYLYLGAGYGERVYAWETTGGQYYESINNTFKGFEVETGFILRFGPFAMTAGVQTNSFKYLEINAGIGAMF